MDIVRVRGESGSGWDGCWTKPATEEEKAHGIAHGWWRRPGRNSGNVHVQHTGNGWAGNSSYPWDPNWVTPEFPTKEACALYLNMMENTQTEEK